MSRSKAFNFIDGAGVITGGSCAVYLNPVIVPKNCHILALRPADILLNSLAISSLLFLGRNIAEYHQPHDHKWIVAMAT